MIFVTRRDPARRRRVWALLLVAALCVGCGGGGTIDELERWTLEPDLRIGEVDGANALANVVGLEVGPNGAMHVVEWSTGSVRVYAQDGRFVRRIGRSGDGPGEFTYNAGRLWPLGDSLIASDPLASRFHVFGSDGTLLETVVVRGVPIVEGTGGFTPVAPLAGGAVLGSYSLSIAGRRGTQPPIPVVRFESTDARLDTLALVSSRNVSMLVMLANGGFATTQPLQDGALWQVARDRSGILVVERAAAERADGARFSVTRVDLTGDTVFARAFPYAPIALDEATTDSIVEEFTHSRAHDDRFAEGALRKAIREALYLPSHLPPVTDLVAGRDGTIWLRREEIADSVDWLVLDERGEPLARVSAPAGLQLHSADGDHAWGVVKDELGVEYVVRYAVRR